MRFILLVKFRTGPTEETIAQNLEMIEEEVKEGIQFIDIYWTLGRYDAVAIVEAPDVEAAMRMSIRRCENHIIETMVAIPAVEARRFVER
ncbi:MAG TPA: GYD domain-containing protein [bacterium]|nr:GYD domain-containing protein [bacterium]